MGRNLTQHRTVTLEYEDPWNREVQEEVQLRVKVNNLFREEGGASFDEVDVWVWDENDHLLADSWNLGKACDVPGMEQRILDAASAFVKEMVEEAIEAVCQRREAKWEIS